MATLHLNSTLLKALETVALRQNAIFIERNAFQKGQKTLTETTSVLLANATKLGFTFSEPLLHALNGTVPTVKINVLNVLKEVVGVDKNWTPLVKGWDIPTGETLMHHVKTFFANKYSTQKGATLSCGHLIPENSFPIERYNGCPFCGTPFEFGAIEKYGQGSTLKILALWTEVELEAFYVDLLQSKTALDATQIASLKTLVDVFDVPKNLVVGMKETLMLLIDVLVEKGEASKVQPFFQSPTDILRYLWYKKTGFLQIIEPKTIIKRKGKNSKHLFDPVDRSAVTALEIKTALALKYNRVECLRVAIWLNNLPLDAEKCCEIMHPKRGMWIRFIRALRLPEYGKHKGFEKLKHLLDVFYNKTYPVWESKVNHFRLRQDAGRAFALLQRRPGLFARSLFANMLWFGADCTLAAFREIIDEVPTRLVLTLNMYAKNYFDKSVQRSVKPLGGTNKRIPANRHLALYDDKQLLEMQSKIEDLCLFALKNRFAKQPNEHKTMYIEPSLFNMPLAIGDRSDTVQDLPVALMGTKFTVEGDAVRLFMQWGKGLPAQHLDMDLSCQIAYEHQVEICSYSNLVATGCKHSGDIRSIPNEIGTAEYIELDINALQKASAKYVSFTCNAYSNGSITPNLVVGWMNSKYPMAISEATGVAYDPSCVQHQVRIVQTIAKGLVFGVLEVKKKEITWLEMTFGGQIVGGLDHKGVQALLSKLHSKLSIGNLLTLKAEAQGITILEEKTLAEEIYDMPWAINAAAVTKLFVD